MPTAGWWEALWPDPADVLAKVGLRPGMDVTDLCSGDGRFTLQIAKIASHVAAIDIDPSLLEVARHRLNESGVQNCDFILQSTAEVIGQKAALIWLAINYYGISIPNDWLRSTT